MDPEQRFWTQKYGNCKWRQTCLQQCNSYSARDREFRNRKEDTRLGQEADSCSSRITKNTGTAQGNSNRGRCVRTGAVPEFKNRNWSLTMVPLCPSCRSCNRMGARSPKPGTSFVVGTATDDQGPPDSSSVAVPTKQQASWEPQLDVSEGRDPTN